MILALSLRSAQALFPQLFCEDLFCLPSCCGVGLGKSPEVVPDGAGRRAEGGAKKIEDFRLRSLCSLINSCLYYIFIIYYIVSIYIDIYT